jgi:hypothetical protein
MGGYGVRNSIFGVYEDIDPSYCSGTEGVYAGVLGEYPCRTYCVSYYRIPLYNNHSVKNSYQIVLYEGSNVIDVYADYRGCCSSTNEGKGIIGVLSSDGIYGVDGIAAPGRNVSSPRWTVTTAAQKEGWRFIPITAKKPVYNITWYQGAGINGPVLGNADTLNVSLGDGNDIVTVRLQFTACNGDEFDLRDTTFIRYRIDTVSIAETICKDNFYTEHGFNESEAGFYTNILQKTNGCDSIAYKLTLEVNEPFTHSLTDTICYGESVTYRGQTFNSTGVYTFFDIYPVTGCDSLRDTLYLSVLPPVTFSVTVQDAMTGPYSGALFITGIPPNGYYEINGVVNAPTTNLHAGSYTIIVYNEYGCQSLPQTVEITTECVSVVFDKIDEVCADAPQFSIPYTITEGLAYAYSLEFNAKAQAAGFTDVIEEPFSANVNMLSYFDVPLPANVRPDNYQVTVKFPDYGCENVVSQTLDFKILYPSSIVAQKWNDVLAVYNQNYNGGYMFSGFRWYYNGVEIPNETGSYYYVGAKEEVWDSAGYYQVALQRVGESDYILSCFIETDIHNAYSYSIRPTIVSANQPVTILFGLRTITVTIYNSMGVPMNVSRYTGGNAQMYMPSQPGIYTVVLTEDETGNRVTERVLVE